MRIWLDHRLACWALEASVVLRPLGGLRIVGLGGQGVLLG